MNKQRSNIIKNNITYKLSMRSEFFILNVIALKLYTQYKYNIYLLVFIFMCIISSIIFRSFIISYVAYLT
jgi:hypothetical protein